MLVLGLAAAMIIKANVKSFAADVQTMWYDEMTSKLLIQTGNNERLKKAI